ncbi:unnamed protein product [Effrenium voratum]|nr:unnamed protein product [Effrenium voratum]CAJ1394285.1 unnamed protein product [Effrenium voratum]CAJ1434203.1 unnamed protein product [Effrenium voratum]
MRVSILMHQMDLYYTDLTSAVAEKKHELEEIQKQKDKGDPWVAFLLDMVMGALFCPAVGRFKSSSLVEGLKDLEAIVKTMQNIEGVMEKSITSLKKKGIDKIKIELQNKFRNNPANRFLDALKAEQRTLIAAMQANMGNHTDAEIYSLYVSYSPQVASKENILSAVDSAFDTWETQINGLGWHTQSVNHRGRDHFYNTWEGIVRVEMDMDGRWLKDQAKYKEAWEHLAENPYARLRNDGGSEQIAWNHPDVMAYVDEWTYPGLTGSDGKRRPKVAEGFVGIWTGPFSTRFNCNGKCCDEKGKNCRCEECTQRTDSIKFSQLFRLNPDGKTPGDSCRSDSDCLTKACCWGGWELHCCVGEDDWKFYPFHGHYCMNQPEGWPCDNDSAVCAKGLTCQEISPRVGPTGKKQKYSCRKP